MALTGLQIQKLLPRTNCRECGANTCMAFAMKLAAGKADLALCPYASDEARAILGAAAEPPVRELAIGAGRSLKTGGDIVLYRHEKTFVHPTALAVNVTDADDPDSVEQTLLAVRDYELERVGEKLRIDMVAVTQEGSDRDAFIALAQKAHAITGRPLILRSSDPDALEAAALKFKDAGFVLASATPDTAQRLSGTAAGHGHLLALTAPDMDSLTACATDLRDGGFRDIILQPQTLTPAEHFQTNAIMRRAALKDRVKPVGYPLLRFLPAGEDLMSTAAAAATEVLKYGGICVLPLFDAALLATLMTLRLNIFTDPQKPIQVEPDIYPIGEPGKDSPVFVTTNFSLTYFIVSGEIENSGTSAWLVVPECEGMSVLTAWAAGKFSGASIARFIKGTDLEERVATRTLTIPGHVSVISGELEENLPGWKVMVGPQDAADIESFVKTRLNT